MKLLFIDDSFQAKTGLYGHGGIVIDESRVRDLSLAFGKLKRQFKIPENIELKWAPDRKHYLNTAFKGSRTDLNRACLELLAEHDVRAMCALHRLSDCYGVKEHGWSEKEARRWATYQQISYLAERFSAPVLSRQDTNGLMILDRFSNFEEEKALATAFEFDLKYGTYFQKLDRIALNVLSADSSLCPPLELADLVIGITVAWLGGGKWSEELFEDIAKLLIHRHEGSRSFASVPSAGIIGYGLKLFPLNLANDAQQRFKGIDGKFFINGDGFQESRPKKVLKLKLARA